MVKNKQSKDMVYCPKCKKFVSFVNNYYKAECGDNISDLFEKEVRKKLKKKWGISFKQDKIEGVKKKFDLVSIDKKAIGDCKFYKDLKNAPSGKNATIAEFVWLLQNTNAKRKFLVFGRSKKIPIKWHRKYGNLVKDIDFYFYDMNSKKLVKLNELPEYN